MKFILKTNDAGIKFKLNFIVLFVSLMAECTTMGCCNLSVLRKISNENMIPTIDWCKFIYEKIWTSKQRWNRNKNSCFYAGPLTYITLLYVEETICTRDEIPDKRPALCAWKIGHLRK